MTRRPPQLHVHVERVVLHGTTPVGPDALAAAIQSALVERLAPSAPPAPAVTHIGGGVAPAAATHIGHAVAPAVLSAIGIEGRR
jgi:hypothetical protein